MLYLAQYLSSGSNAEPCLKLLARQQSPRTWQVIDAHEVAPFCLSQPLDPPTGPEEAALLSGGGDDRRLSPGVLLLVNVEGNKVLHWESASPWIVSIVHTYLGGGETPEFLNQERNRLEAWRQQLTLEQQELGRKLLEVEARLAKIQTIEPEIEPETETPPES
ncbi:MAG: hypothetical protein ACO331_15170 [Prochlorothrix sp.]